MDKTEKTMTNPATVIGAATHVKGNLEGDEDLRVVGRVDGNINLTKTLTVDPNGVVVADVQVREAIISGQVVGNVTATELVHITEQGRVVGDLTTPRVVLVDGASFRGAIDMGDLGTPAARPPGPRTRPSRARPEPAEEPAPEPAPKPVPRPAPPPRRVVPQSKPKPRPKPADKKKADTLDKRAEAAAKAVASQAKKPKAKPAKKKKAPKPPTTAGKRTRARRK